VHMVARYQVTGDFNCPLLGEVMSPAEGKFLQAICAMFPRQVDPGAVIVNVVEIGHRLSLSEDESKTIARSLPRQGFLHLRDMQNIVLAHPTPAARDCVASRSGFFRSLGQSLIGKKS